MPYQRRLADAYLSDLLAEFPAVMITGARATGKTSTAMQHCAHIERLDQPGVAAMFRADPDAALRRVPRPVLLDEWQEAPGVLAAVKRVVDADPTPGQFVLTGSVRAELTNETWAGTGRIVRINMYPLSERERIGSETLDRIPFLERLATSGIGDIATPRVAIDIDDYINMALRSGFPELFYRDRTEPSRGTWLASYLDDLVTRDAASLDQAKDPVKLRRYVNALALNNAGMPSDATVYRSAGVNAKTAGVYDQLLRNLFILDVVPAWAHNRLQRLIKAGKRYFIDTGLAAVASGLTAESILRSDDLVGRTFDSFATAQLRAEIALSYPRPALHHLRVEAGRHEIDLVAEMGRGRIIGIEYKASAAPSSKDARHLLWLRDQMSDDFIAGVVVHSGPAIYELGDRVFAVPLCCMWS